MKSLKKIFCNLAACCWFLLTFVELLSCQEDGKMNYYSSSDAEKPTLKQERYSMVQSSAVLNLTGILSKQVKLPCVVERDRKFIWMRSERDEIISIDKTLITNDKRLSLDSSQCQSRHVSRSEGSDGGASRNDCLIHLVINDLTVNDEGLYLCQIDTMTSTKIFLNVLVSPSLNKISYTVNMAPSSSRQPKQAQCSSPPCINDAASTSQVDTSISLEEGSSLDLACDVNGRPKPNISWYIKEENQTNSTMAIGKGSELSLKNLTRNSYRKYECVAENGISPSLSRLVTINVLHAPRINHELMEVENCPENPSENVTIEKQSGHLKIKQLTLSCSASSNPKPRFEWFLNGSRLDLDGDLAAATGQIYHEILEDNSYESEHIFSSKLVIQNKEFMDPDLLSRYECRAANQLGQAEPKRIEICYYMSETIRELRSRWERKMRKKQMNLESTTHKLIHHKKSHAKNRKEIIKDSVSHHFHHFHRHSSADANATVGHLSRKHHHNQAPSNESHSTWYRDYLDRKRTLASIDPRTTASADEDPEVQANRFEQSSQAPASRQPAFYFVSILSIASLITRF